MYRYTVAMACNGNVTATGCVNDGQQVFCSQHLPDPTKRRSTEFLLQGKAILFLHVLRRGGSLLRLSSHGGPSNNGIFHIFPHIPPWRMHSSFEPCFSYLLITVQVDKNQTCPSCWGLTSSCDQYI